MDCTVCANLEQKYAVALSDYLEARSSACYGISTKPAARKYVEMERARYELEEHRLVCAYAATPVPMAPAPVAPKRVPVGLRQVAA